MNSIFKRIPRFKTYEEAVKFYDPKRDKWKVFDGSRENFNIAYECIDRHAESGRVAYIIQHGDGRVESVTFARLSKLSSKMANTLKDLGIKKGDRVLVILDQSLEFYTTFYGILKAGGVAVICSVLHSKEAIEYRLKDSNASVIIGWEEKLKEIEVPDKVYTIKGEELINYIRGSSLKVKEYNTSANDLAVIQYTSGTTGLPKPIPYAHRSLVNLVPTVLFGYGLSESDRFCCPSSVAWGHGVWTGTMAATMFGSTSYVYSGKFNPQLTLEFLEEYEINNIALIATALRKIMKVDDVKDYRLNLEKIAYTGEGLAAEDYEKAKGLFGVYPHSIYGTTEVGVIILDYQFPDYKVKPGALGKPMLGLEVMVVDEKGNKLPPGQVGEIVVKIRDRLRRTSDLGFVDNDGYFWHKGRADDVIKYSGYRIDPTEIEWGVAKHPAVNEVGVVGIPDPMVGQKIVAFISLKEGYKASEELKKDIIEFAKRNLSRYMYPREIVFIDKLPRTLDGKIRRKELREKYSKIKY